MSIIYHLTSAADWAQAQAAGQHTPPSLASEGFIHCSTAAQVVKVANKYYRAVPDCLLLWVETDKLTAEVKWEAPAHPDPNNPPETAPNELFPHIYGALNLTAVIHTSTLPKDAEGFFTQPEDLPTASVIEMHIHIGRNLETDETAQQAIAYLQQLTAHYPDNALVQFEMGGAYDFAGYEAEAIPHYEQAIALGLPEAVLPRVAVQLGSSLRNIGKYAEAVSVLRDASQKFPEHRSLRVFLALALHSAGNSQAALVELLDMVINTPDVLEAYQRSLRYYTDELRA
jgi:uncharacterized protein (DUF952 family)/Tfp pilus assembly protein PilF